MTAARRTRRARLVAWLTSDRAIDRVADLAVTLMYAVPVVIVGVVLLLLGLTP